MPAQTMLHVSYKELAEILKELHLSADSRLTIGFDDPEINLKAIRRQKALEAMKQLRGSGNPGLVDKLLQSRKVPGI